MDGAEYIGSMGRQTRITEVGGRYADIQPPHPDLKPLCACLFGRMMISSSVTFTCSSSEQRAGRRKQRLRAGPLQPSEKTPGHQQICLESRRVYLPSLRDPL